MKLWKIEWTNEIMRNWMNEWNYEKFNERMKLWKIEWTNERKPWIIKLNEKRTRKLIPTGNKDIRMNQKWKLKSKTRFDL